MVHPVDVPTVAIFQQEVTSEELHVVVVVVGVFVVVVLVVDVVAPGARNGSPLLLLSSFVSRWPSFFYTIRICCSQQACGFTRALWVHATHSPESLDSLD